MADRVKTTGDFVLGIDLGANLVGWALVARKDGNPSKLLQIGSRVFDAGMDGDLESGREESRNLKRREARLHRRQLWRRGRRMRKIFHLLQTAGLLPPGKCTQPAERQDSLNELDKSILAPPWFASGEKSGSFAEAHQVLPYLLRSAAAQISVKTGQHRRSLRGAKMERVSEVLQFPVIIERRGPFSLEPQLL